MYHDIRSHPDHHGQLPHQQLTSQTSTETQSHNTTQKKFFEQKFASFVSWVKQSPYEQPSIPFQVAGEPDLAFMQAGMNKGIEIDDQTWADIVHAAKQFDVPINK